MEQHPIPRQITTFEFKLVGFMTLHQFLYLLVFVPMGFVVFKIVPIPVLNVVFGIIVSAFGMLLAFLPVNDRPLDVFVKNLYKRLTSPTQYIYKKTNVAPAYLDNGHVSASTKHVQAHLDSQDKLTRYMETKAIKAEDGQNVADLKMALDEPLPEMPATKLPPVVVQAAVKPVEQPKEMGPSATQQPFFIGVVKNNKETPLPEILVYVKDENNNPVRLLKTNPNGVFATYSSLPQGEYMMEAKDPRGSYMFDTMKIRLGDSNPSPFTMQSKGML